MCRRILLLLVGRAITPHPCHVVWSNSVSGDRLRPLTVFTVNLHQDKGWLASFYLHFSVLFVPRFFFFVPRFSISDSVCYSLCFSPVCLSLFSPFLTRDLERGCHGLAAVCMRARDQSRQKFKARGPGSALVSLEIALA